MLYAQTWNLPDSRRNDRHGLTDRYDIARPALSIRGFDSQDLPSHYNTFDHAKVYGVKQVLERAMGIGMSVDDSVFDVLDKILIESLSTIDYSNTSIETVELNASKAKSIAAVAVFTYIIEKNTAIFDTSKTNLFPNMPTHSAALAKLMDYLTNPPSDISPDHSVYSPFKKGKAAMNIAQMWDMYLALENAYDDLDGSTIADANLLNSTQKAAWNSRIFDFMREIHVETKSPVDMGLFNANAHEVQPGNWALISFVTCGYMLLGFNGAIDVYQLNPDVVLTDAMVSVFTTRHSSGLPTRRYYYNYQSGGGSRYWAEGAYYLSITLEHAVPFVHALRSNDWLPFDDGVNGSLGADPFNDPDFLNPINWLADIATPDGRTPAIDDGNKVRIYPAQILNWSSDYGGYQTSQTGEKFQ